MTADRQDYGGVRDRHQHENTRVGCYSGKTNSFSLPVIVSLRPSFSTGGVARSHASTARERRRPSSFAARSRVLSQTPQNYFNLVQRDAILQNINILLTDRFNHIFPIVGSGQKVNSLVRSRLYRIKKSRKQVNRKISSALSC